MKFLSSLDPAGRIAKADNIDVFSDRELGDAVKAVAFTYDKHVGKWGLPGPIGLAKLALAEGATGVICPVDLPLDNGKTWNINVSVMKHPDGSLIEDSRRLFYNHLCLPAAEERNGRHKESWLTLFTQRLHRLVLWRVAAYRRRGSVRLLRVPSKDLGAAVRTILRPFRMRGNRVKGLFVAADLLNAIAEANEAGASYLELNLGHAWDKSGVLGDIETTIFSEEHKPADREEDLVTRTWYPKGTENFRAFTNRFSLINRMNRHEEDGRVTHVTLHGILREEQS